jgi:predicted nucleic-acid-binding protein
MVGFQLMNAYISNWFVLTQIFMLCLSYRPEAEFIQSIVDKIYSDSSLIVYEDGQIGMGSLVEEMNQRIFAFLAYAGGVGPRPLSLFIFFYLF